MKILTKSTLSIIFITLIFNPNFLHSQISDELRYYLWQKDFRYLIEKFAQEKITFRDKGDIRKRLEARPYVEKGGIRAS